MRSKKERVFDGVAIFFPILLIVVFSFLIVRSILGIQAGTNDVFVDKLSIIILLIISTITIATSTVPHIIRRDIDKEVAANLMAELESIKKQLCTSNKYNERIPLHHDFFDSLKKSGMTYHINPKYLYEVEHVYWLVNEYNRYSRQLKKDSKNGNKQVIEQNKGQTMEQIKKCIDCLCKDLEGDAKWRHKKTGNCRKQCITESNTQDSADGAVRTK